jgi:hypothetical protein
VKQEKGMALVFICLILFISPLCQVFGQEIVYNSSTAGSHDIWVMDSSGGNKINVSAVSHDPFHYFNEVFPRWSPDGARICFASNKSGCTNVWIMDANGENDYNLTNSGRQESYPFWSSDGNKICFARNAACDSGASCALNEIFIIDLQSGLETQLTNNGYRELIPTISPDLSQIAFLKAERAYDNCNTTDIWVMNLDGSNQHFVYGDAGLYEWTSDWGKICNKILFSKMFVWPTYQVVYMDADGTNAVRLTFDSHDNVAYCFSPDNNEILVVSNREGNYDLWIMDLNGNFLTKLTDDAAYELGADWNPMGGNRPPIAICKDITIAATGGCQAIIKAEDLDGGSSDPDGDQISFAVDNSGPFPPGEYNVVFTVTDEHNLSDSCQAKVIIEDRTPPIPILATLPTITGECSARVMSAPTAIDDCFGSVIGTTSDPLEYTNQGTYTIIWTYIDNCGNFIEQTQTLIVKDLTPPLATLSVSPEILWPPNHKMIKITPTFNVTDNCDSNPTVVLKNIVMNEGDQTSTYDPLFDSTISEGMTTGDIYVDATGNIFLRAERAGNGPGRIYTLTFTVTDSSNNSITVSALIKVPHNI